MGKYKRLVNNSLIFAVGNLGSKIIIMLLVPLYTYTLTTSEYGTADLLTSVINLSLPIASLSIFEATLRFVMDKINDSSKIIINGLFVTGVSSIIITVLSILAYIIWPNNSFIIAYFAIILILQIFQTLLAQYLRGIGKVKVFAFNGIINAVTLGVTNFLFLYVLNLKLDGYFLSIIIANVISNIYLIFNSRLRTIFTIKKYDLEFIGDMLSYSIPLIPNSLMWWIVNTSSRYFILLFSGVDANGLFAVSAKIPSIITIFQSIFFQAWQLSAIDEFSKENRNEFYKNIFSAFSSFMFILTSVTILFLKPIIKFAVSDAYYSSWEFVPFLLVGVLFSSFSSFMGTLYVASKDTKEIMVSSFIGAGTNIITCLLLVPTVGTNGAAIASAVSFIIIFFYRTHDIKSKINLSINLRFIFICTGLLLIQILLLFNFDILSALPLVILLILNRQKIFSLVYYLKMLSVKNKK